MTDLELFIGGHSYRIACADGQDEALRELAAVVNFTIEEQRSQSGVLSETRQLLFAALTLADAVRDTRNEIEMWNTLRPQLEGMEQTARAIDNLAERMEILAGDLEKSIKTS
jgi:cell division protein ZapA